MRRQLTIGERVAPVVCGCALPGLSRYGAFAFGRGDAGHATHVSVRDAVVTTNKGNPNSNTQREDEHGLSQARRQHDFTQLQRRDQRDDTKRNRDLHLRPARCSLAAGNRQRFEDEVRITFERLRSSLANLGAGMTHVVNIKTFVTDLGTYGVYSRIRDEFFPRTRRPPARRFRSSGCTC